MKLFSNRIQINHIPVHHRNKLRSLMMSSWSICLVLDANNQFMLSSRLFCYVNVPRQIFTSLSVEIKHFCCFFSSHIVVKVNGEIGSKRAKYSVMQKQENESDEIKRTIFTLLLRFTSFFTFGSQIYMILFVTVVCLNEHKRSWTKTTCFSSHWTTSCRLYLNHLNDVFFFWFDVKKRIKAMILWNFIKCLLSSILHRFRAISSFQFVWQIQCFKTFQTLIAIAFLIYQFEMEFRIRLGRWRKKITFCKQVRRLQIVMSLNWNSFSIPFRWYQHIPLENMLIFCVFLNKLWSNDVFRPRSWSN